MAMSTKLYLLGDVLDDVKLRNKTTKALLRHMTADLTHPHVTLTKLIWTKLPQVPS
jgi:hypothetical protein